MQLSLEFQKKLKNKHATFTNKELENGLRLSMIDFIEKNIMFNELIVICECLRKEHSKQLHKKFLEAINKLYRFNEDVHNSKKEQLSNDQITFFVDDLLDSMYGLQYTKKQN